jgi:hypothetical protein
MKKVRCIENRFSLRVVGPDTFGFVTTDTPLPNLVVGKVYHVGGVFGEFMHVFDESYEGAVWPAEFFEWVDEDPLPPPTGRVIPFRRKRPAGVKR